MRKWMQFFLMGIMMIVFFSRPGLSEAAHFSYSGTSNIHTSTNKTVTLTGLCDSYTDLSTADATTTIDPDPGENIGDPVTITYCYSAAGSTSITGPGYTAVGGVGSSLLTADCSPGPTSNNPGPATVTLNPGPLQQIVFSYGPQNISGNATLSLINQCGSVLAHIGDTLQADGGIYAVLGGPAPDPGTNATITFTVDVNLPSQAQAKTVPTLTEWGMILLVILLGAGSLHYLRRRRTAV